MRNERSPARHREKIKMRPCVLWLMHLHLRQRWCVCSHAKTCCSKKKKKNPISMCCLSDLFSFSWLPVSAELILPLFSSSVCNDGWVVGAILHAVFIYVLFLCPPSTARATRDWSAGDLIKAPVGGRFWKICCGRNQHIFKETSAIRSTNNRWQGRQWEQAVISVDV